MTFTASAMEYLSRKMGKPSGTGPEYAFDCPACLEREGSESRGKKFHWNVAREKGHCFRCEFKVGSLDHLLVYLTRGRLGIQERILLRRDPPIVTGTVRKSVYSIFNRAPDRPVALRPQQLPAAYVRLDPEVVRQIPYRRAWDYLQGRKVSMDTVLRYEIGYCTEGRYQGYLIFPIYQDGVQVYWTSRSVTGHWAKSQNPDRRDGYFSRSDVLLNFDAVRGMRRVAMVEGPFDCTASDPAVTPLGKEVSPAQMELIARLVEEGLEELVLMFDPGTGSVVDELRIQLADIVPVSTVFLEHGDPADCVDDMPDLIRSRTRFPALVDRVRARFHG